MRDPGLQPERTSLAWTRTAWSMLVTAGVWLKIGTESHRLGITATGIFLLAGAFLAWVIGVRRRNELLSRRAVKAPSAHLMAAVALGVLVSAVGAMAMLCT